MMVKVVQAIESRYIPAIGASHPLTGKAQCSINLIKGGTVINVIPAECEIHIDRRVVPGEDPHQVLPTVERVLDELRRDEPNLRAVQDEPFIDPSLDSSMNPGLTGRICRVLEEAGLPSSPEGAKYGTEASNLAQAGIEAVVLGPGSVAQAHTADEWLSVDQLHLACRVYLEIMSEGIGYGV
jgi:acetylornithine deacetylase